MSKRPSLADNLKAFAAEPAPPPVSAPPVAPPAPIATPREQSGRAKTREGMKLLLTPVEPRVHKKLKLLAVKQDSTMERIVREALDEFLERHGEGGK